MPRITFETQPIAEAVELTDAKLTVSRAIGLIALDQAGLSIEPRNINSLQYIIGSNEPLPYEVAIYAHQNNRIRSLVPLPRLSSSTNE